MSDFRLAALLGVAGLPHALRFATLFGVLALCWALPSTVIPLEALALLGDAQRVSIFFFAVSFVGLAGNLFVPALMHAVGQRRVFAFGAACMAASAVLFPLGQVAALFAAMALYVLGYLCMDLALNVTIMIHIPRREFTRFEPIRMLAMGVGFIIGPWLGVWLAVNLGFWTTVALMAALGVAAVAYALSLHLVEDAPAAARPARPPNPLRFIPRFASQPRLRLAWLLAVGRSSWWTMFFIYTPIYCVENGLGPETAGIILSAGAVPMLLVPLWGRLGRRIGLRRLLTVGYLTTGAATAAIAAVGSGPWPGIALLLFGTICAGLIDAAGNSLFLRAVRPNERAEMTAVFATYREVAKIGPPGVYAALLSVFALPAVFATAGAGMVVLTWFTRYIPRRY